MQTTDTPGRTPRRKDAHSNRRRILATVRLKLREDPDASLDSISEAAGVARRTLCWRHGRWATTAACSPPWDAAIRERPRSAPPRHRPAQMPALAEVNAACPWTDPTGEAAATAFLVAAGVAPAALQVREVVRRDRAADAG
ncbi:hypothetical protein SAMN05428944_2199 [Streptomyces sp. 1222.5]|nr:hypothetical protein BX260_5895 [Streptomyces sp. 5112.2]SEC01632.1 hypothetical protein SAMN05428944_2199 [Streptomyces sp. 1222.5]